MEALLGTPITPRAAGDRKAWDTPQGGAGTLGQVSLGCLGGQNCSNWQDPRCYHQLPELNSTLWLPVLPWHKPLAVGRGSLVAGSLSYTSGHTVAGSRCHLGCAGQTQPR